jgi:hypothetical protein
MWLAKSPSSTCGPADHAAVGHGQSRTAKRLPVLTMVCGHSRWADAVLIRSRAAEDLLAGWWQLLAELGAVPRAGLGRGRRGRPHFRGGPSHASTSSSGPPTSYTILRDVTRLGRACCWSRYCHARVHLP